MIATGREQARASRLASGARSPLSPTIRGVELCDVVRGIFQIPEPSATQDKDKDTTGGLVTNHYLENFLILITLLLFVFASS